MNSHLAAKVAGDLWGVLGVIWVAAAFTNKRTSQREQLASRAREIALVALAVWLMMSSDFPVRLLNARFVPATPAVAGAGLAIELAGVLIALWARVYLGRNWSGMVEVKQDHRLITGGPYSLVRHPIYTGLLSALAGTAVVIGEVRCLAAVIVLTLCWWMKWTLEERFMSRQFGAAYDAYRQRTGAIIPRLP